MNSTLLLPINLQALIIDQEISVAQAMADFSRLPYQTAKQAYNPNTANISEDIVSQPFEDRNLWLQPGLHLHWRLPKIIAQGRHGATGLNLPPVPNRWLVSRLENHSSQQQWIVESDYLHPEGQGVHSGSISFPFEPDAAKGQAQPFRYLGRKMPLSDWAADADAAYLCSSRPLTAIGYGEPTFASFYPNCHSVFACHDASCTATPPTTVVYEVIGFYSNSAIDFLNWFSNTIATSGDTLAALTRYAAIRAAPSDDTPFPQQTLCYGKLTFPGGSSAIDTSSANLQVSVGNSGTEALSACLAHRLSGDTSQTPVLEDQLNAVEWDKQLSAKPLDQGAEFLATRHQKGFRALSGGTLWELVPVSSAPAASKATATTVLGGRPRSRQQKGQYFFIASFFLLIFFIIEKTINFQPNSRL